MFIDDHETFGFHVLFDVDMHVAHRLAVIHGISIRISECLFDDLIHYAASATACLAVICVTARDAAAAAEKMNLLSLSSACSQCER